MIGMCGILGSTYKEGNFDSALDKMRYRGPDDKKVMDLHGCTLGFVRLSIRDLTMQAMQPMYSEDGKVYIVYNGEIYGYGKLKRSLEQKGYVFKTSCDTEVILYAYLEYGSCFIDHIDGMFAIAIYDMRNENLILFRDRIGIKPLYYYYNGTDLTFASELKAIVSLHSKINFKRDNSAVYDYFTYRYIPEPKTLYQDIYKLEPAYKLTFDLRKRNVYKEKYWKLRINTSMSAKHNRKDLYGEVRRLIGKSVKEQLTADVPIGTFLSGGIDSSIVSAEIFKRTKKVQAFSMGFRVRTKDEQVYDETSYAKLLAKIYVFPITVGQFDRMQLKRIKSYIKDWYDEPFADTSCYPTYMISKMAKENYVPVILTGDGGDEVFGGYTRYTVYNQKAGERKSWSILCDLYTKLLKNVLTKEEWEEEFLDAVSLFAREAYAYTRCEKRAYIKKLGIGYGYDDFWYFRKFYHKELPPITRAQYIDFNTYLPADILTKVDRVSMQNSIETRVPLLSKELVEFSFGLSQEERCPKGELKGILKEAYRGIIPKEILDKSKKGFSFPSSYWESNQRDRFLLWEENWV